MCLLCHLQWVGAWQGGEMQLDPLDSALLLGTIAAQVSVARPLQQAPFTLAMDIKQMLEEFVHRHSFGAL